MINFAIIGTNFITDLFLNAAAMQDDLHLKAVYSRSLAHAKEYGKKYGADLFFDDLNDLAECPEIDAVYIASPNSFHAPQSILMMNHGKHVLCEKPTASNLEEFQQMRETAFKNQVVLLEAMRPVHNPSFTAIRDNLWKLGTLRRVTFQFCKYSSRYEKFKNGIIENAFNPEFSNSALMDLGVYCVHPLVALFGLPEHISSDCIKLHNGMEGAGTVLLHYKDMLAELIYSKISTSDRPSEIQGENGTMLIDGISIPKNIRIQYNAGQEEVISYEKSSNDIIFEIRDFIHLIENKEINHQFLPYSEMELTVMDSVRKQQGIFFPADK